MGKCSVALVVTPIMFFLSCNSSQSIPLEGKLFYTGGGNSIKVLSFGEKESEPIVIYEKANTVVVINHITKMSDTVLFYDECSGRAPCMINQLNISNNESRPIRTGFFPQFIPGHEKLFFYDTSSDDGNWLFMASLRDGNAITRIAKEPKAKTLPNGIQQSRTTPVVQISKDEVAFLNEEGELTLYNISNPKISPLGIKECRPILWRPTTQQLFCTNWTSKEVFSLDLHTKKLVKVPELYGAYGLVYIAGLDSFIYGKTRSVLPLLPLGVAYDIFFYSFSKQKEIRIKKNSHIAAGNWINR